jgi:hypothetical protein
MKIVHKTESTFRFPEDIWWKIIHEYILTKPNKKYWLYFRSFDPVINELTNQKYLLFTNIIFNLTSIFMDKQTVTKYIPTYGGSDSIDIEVYTSLKNLLKYIYYNIHVLNTRESFVTKVANIKSDLIYKLGLNYCGFHYCEKNLDDLKKNKEHIIEICDRQVSKMWDLKKNTTNLELTKIMNTISSFASKIIYICYDNDINYIPLTGVYDL